MRFVKNSIASTHSGLLNATPMSSVSSHPLARAKYSNVCWVKTSPGMFAAVMP